MTILFLKQCKRKFRLLASFSDKISSTHAVTSCCHSKGPKSGGFLSLPKISVHRVTFSHFLAFLIFILNKMNTKLIVVS